MESKGMAGCHTDSPVAAPPRHSTHLLWVRHLTKKGSHRQASVQSFKRLN